jgi:plasmid stabilization system protein ParE
MPLAYMARPELGDHIRACPHGRYVIFYRAKPGTFILIVRILHGARSLVGQFPYQP